MLGPRFNYQIEAMTLGNMRANGVPPRGGSMQLVASGLLQCNSLGVEGLRSSPVSERDPRFQVAVRATAEGRFTFQIFTLSGEPRTFHADSQTYATPADAAQAGYDAIAAARYPKS
jgi:hypothetical protein